jgi:hypothetical protein
MPVTPCQSASSIFAIPVETLPTQSAAAEMYRSAHHISVPNTGLVIFEHRPLPRPRGQVDLTFAGDPAAIGELYVV